MKKVRAGLIGCGRIGARWEWEDKLREKPCTHLGAYLRHPDVDLVFVSDVDGAAADRARRFANGSPVAIESISDIDLTTDVVSVATDVTTHHSIVMNLCSLPTKIRPKVILCEKPLADSVKSAREMVNRCREARIKLACNLTRRWDLTWQMVKSKVEKIKPVHGVGIFSGDILNTGIHMADLSNWLMKEEPLNPIRLNVPYLVFEVDIFGEEGRINVRENGTEVHEYGLGRSRRYDGIIEPIQLRRVKQLNGRTPMMRVVDDMVACVKEYPKREPICGGTDGVNALKLCLKWRRKTND